MPALAALDLAVIVFWFGILIFCFLALKIAQALLGTAGGLVGWIPGVGGFVRHRIEDVAQKITHVMGGAMGYADQHVAAAIHDTARLVDWLGREVASHANILLAVAQALTGQLPTSYLLRELHRLEQLGKAAQATAVGIGHDVIPRVQQVERGIGADVLPRLRSLDREVGRVIGRTIPALERDVAGLEHGAIGLWKWVLRHPRSAATTAFAGAVAWALTHLGVNWITCRNWRRVGKEVCGTPFGDLEGFLAIALGAAAIADLRDLVKIAQSVEKVTAQGVKDLLQV